MKDHKFYEEYAIQNDLDEIMDIYMQTIKTIEQIIQQISKLHNMTNNEDTKNKISNEINLFSMLRHCTENMNASDINIYLDQLNQHF